MEIKITEGICIECSSKSLSGKNYCGKCYIEVLKIMDSYYNKRTCFFPEIDKITEKIYLGNEDAQKDKEGLKKEGITHILVCGNQLHIFHPNEFNYKILKIDDSPYQQIDHLFDETFDFIENSEKIFIHCAAGVSRSPSMVIAYLMRKEGLTYEQAYNKVKNKRDSICPNSHFVNQLKKFEEKLIEIKEKI